MTIGEIDRAIVSKQRVMKREEQERAIQNYILGDLIGHSIARIYDSGAKYPELATVYPSLFNKDEIEAEKQRQKDEKSVQNMKKFAESFNKNFKKKKEVAKDNERAT